MKLQRLHIKPSITEQRDESLKAYFRDISKIPLITKEEEIELAYKAQAGDQKAADKLIKANLRFAISVAKQYQGNGLPLVDLIQIANLGLIYSVDKYDPSTNNRFISFAVWHIRQFLTRSLSNFSRTIRLPTSHIQAVSKINKVTQSYLQSHGRRPSQEELEEEITDISKKRIAVGLSTPNKSVSFDSPIKDIDGGTLLDITPSNMFNVTDDSMMNEEASKAIEYILSKLTPRSSDLLRLTYGIGVEAMSLDKAGELFGIGVERVRQVNQKTIQQIKKQFKHILKHLI